MDSIIYPNHFNFSYLPTPVISLKTISAQFPSYQLGLKRDDLTGMELSGNKIRKLDFLLKEAVENGATKVITCGGLQSNHCRATAFAAGKAGLKTVLLLRGSKPEIATGNYLLGLLSAVEIIIVTADEYKNADALMADYAAKSSEKVYVIPEGGSNETGAWGYVKCFYEILNQVAAGGVKCDTIVVASGSGGTHAGLLAGKLISGSAVNVVSVNVCDDAKYFVNKIDSILNRFSEKYNVKMHWGKSDIHVIDGFVGDGYGITSGTEEELIVKLVKDEGIILEPVYTAKAFGGMIEAMKKQNLPGNNIIFIHTGGIFGIFPYWQELLSHLK